MPAKPNPELAFLKARGLDPAEWMADRVSVRESTAANGSTSTSVNASLRRRPGTGIAPALVREMRKLTRPSAGAAHGAGDLLIELHVTDTHIGARTAAGMKALIDTTYRLLKRARLLGKPGEILLVTGGDIMHVDSIRNETTRGTRLEDVALPYQDIFRQALGAMLSIVNAASKVANVKVMVIPGNHDFHLGFALGEALRAAYAERGRVTVDNDTDKFRYHRHGCVLLGFTHGDTVRLNQLPLLMASDRPDDWGETTWREWHTGHVHSQAQLEQGSVRVRAMPALLSRSAWAKNQGYTENHQGIEAYLWSKRDGYLGHLFQGV